MAEHIIDAFLVKFGLDRSDYRDGVREIEEGNKGLRDGSKKTFDDMERFGRKTGESIKGVTREVIGLGLAFMGARSITGFLANLATGAASADRFGKTLGMSVQQVWAWRQAMKSVGGEYGEGDTALQAIQGAKTSFRMGQMSPDQMATYGRLGITGGDLRKSDPGAILSKLAGASGKMDPTLYASLLQQIGLPASTVYFLQQGKDSVDKLLKQYESNSKDAEKAAKQAEQLQVQMAELNSQIQKALLPVLSQIVPLLTEVVKWMGGNVPSGGTNGAPKKSGENWSWGIPGLFEFHSKNGKQTRADRNNNPGNIEDGAFARRQPGYAGGDGRFARFASADHGFAAMQTLLGGYLRRGKNTLSEIIGTWAPSSENDVGAYVAHVSKLTGIKPGQRVGAEHLAVIARAMAAHEGYTGRRGQYSSMMDMHRNFARHSAPRGGNVTIGAITVHTKATDARGIARDIHGALNRRMAVAQTDRVVNP